MDRNTFKQLLNGFEKEANIDNKVDYLLTYELSSLTKPQIQKLLDTLDEPNTKKLISEISKRTGV